MSELEPDNTGTKPEDAEYKVGPGHPPKEYQFKPGCKAGPGRPVGSVSLTTKIRNILERRELNGKPIPNNRDVGDLVAEAIVKAAAGGNFPFAKEILDRIDGKVPDKIEGEMSHRIEYVYDDGTQNHSGDAETETLHPESQ